MEYYLSPSLDDHAGRFAEIDRISILSHDRRAMKCRCKLDCSKGILAPAAMILRGNLRPLVFQPQGQLIGGDNDRAGSFCDRKCITDVVAMTVRDHDEIRLQAVSI